VKASVEEKIVEVKKAKEGSDIAAIKSALESLTTEVSKIGEAMSKAGANTTEANPTPEAQSEEIKDAETKEQPNEAK
jgi:molecular chaperone DnaK